MLTYYNTCIKIVFFFSKRTFNAHSGKRMFNKMSVLSTLIGVRKKCVNERTIKHALLDLHVYHALNVRLPCVFKKACFTHVAHFPVYVKVT